MAKINISGDIVSDEDKWIYDWYGIPAVSPSDVRDVIEGKQKEEKLTVEINSGGGSVFAGQEIYSLLKGRNDVEIEIQSLAGSAASVIAMSNRSRMSPVAMIMIHNVSMVGAEGDHHDMKKNAEILQKMDEALAAAYVEKTGKDKDEILKLMDRETWLTANQSLDMGFVDEIGTEEPAFANALFGTHLTDEMRRKAIEEKTAVDRIEARKQELLKDIDAFGI